MKSRKRVSLDWNSKSWDFKKTDLPGKEIGIWVAADLEKLVKQIRKRYGQVNVDAGNGKVKVEVGRLSAGFWNCRCSGNVGRPVEMLVKFGSLMSYLTESLKLSTAEQPKADKAVQSKPEPVKAESAKPKPEPVKQQSKPTIKQPSAPKPVNSDVKMYLTFDMDNARFNFIASANNSTPFKSVIPVYKLHEMLKLFMDRAGTNMATLKGADGYYHATVQSKDGEWLVHTKGSRRLVNNEMLAYTLACAIGDEAKDKFVKFVSNSAAEDNLGKFVSNSAKESADAKQAGQNCQPKQQKPIGRLAAFITAATLEVGGLKIQVAKTSNTGWNFKASGECEVEGLEACCGVDILLSILDGTLCDPRRTQYCE